MTEVVDHLPVGHRSVMLVPPTKRITMLSSPLGPHDEAQQLAPAANLRRQQATKSLYDDLCSGPTQWPADAGSRTSQSYMQQLLSTDWWLLHIVGAKCTAPPDLLNAILNHPWWHQSVVTCHDTKWLPFSSCMAFEQTSRVRSVPSMLLPAVRANM